MFKICILILKKYSGKLFDKSFEDILFELGTISNSDIFNQQFFDDISNMKLSNRLINEIEKEYEDIIIRTKYNY